MSGYGPQVHGAQALSVDIPAGKVSIRGDLHFAERVGGAVLFAHGSGSSRHSPRNQFVARILQDAGMATLLIDLLTESEEEIDRDTAQFRFDIELLTKRLGYAAEWLLKQEKMSGVKLGCFGASTGAAAALVLATEGKGIAAVVSRGGRPDLAGAALPKVNLPVLLIVGGEDQPTLDLNRATMTHLQGEKKLEIIPNATHLFEEPGTLEQVAQLARQWFDRHLLQCEYRK